MKGRGQSRRAPVQLMIVLLAAVLMLPLTGCVSMLLLLAYEDDVPQQVEVAGETYIGGFYEEELWPNDLEHTEESYKIDGVTFYPVEMSGFTCLHAPHTGGTTNGTLYCLESQWEQAKEYYADPENFSYYCEITPPWIAGTERSDVHRIDDMDSEMFDALRDWVEQRNDPFDGLEQTLGELQEADPIYRPSLPEFYCLFFYKKSNDGFFITFQGDKFFILDGTLYYLRYYDGEDELLHVIEVPEEIAGYFTDLVLSLESPYSIE